MLELLPREEHSVLKVVFAKQVEPWKWKVKAKGKSLFQTFEAVK